MKCLLFLVSFIIGAVAFLPRVRFDVEKSDYIQLCAGEPCTWLTFKVNRSSSEIWLHSSSFIALSQTFHKGPPSSEYFYFDQVRLRLHLIVRPPADLSLATPVIPFDGTFGLDSKAEIWAYWDNYTLSRTRLELGGYVNFAQRDPWLRPPILEIDDDHEVTLADGTEAVLRFNLNTVESLIPYESNISTALRTLEIKNKNCKSHYQYLDITDGNQCTNDEILHTDEFQSLKLINGVEYEAISYSPDNALVIGTHLIDEFVAFHGISCGCIMFAEDAFTLDYVTLMAGISLLLFSLLSIWIVIAESDNDRSNEWEFRVMIACELFSYLINVLTYYLGFHILDWGRYVTQYIEGSAWFVMIYLPLMTILSFGTLAYTAYNCKDYKEYLTRFRDNGLFHAAVFSLTQMGFIWLAIVEEHESIFNRALLAIIVTVACIFGTVALGFIYLAGKKKYFQTLFLVMIASYYFLIRFSLIPMFTYASLRQSIAVACAVWLMFFVFIPSLMLLASHELVKRWSIIKKNK